MKIFIEVNIDGNISEGKAKKIEDMVYDDIARSLANLQELYGMVYDEFRSNNYEPIPILIKTFISKENN